MAFEGSVIFSYASGVGGYLNVEGSVYIYADGRSIPKASYPRLYAVISGRYGETVSDFVIPDMRGYCLRGDSLDSNRDNDYSTRVLYGPSAVTSGVGTYQPSSLIAHTHNMGGIFPSNRNPPAPGGPQARRYLSGSPTTNVNVTSGVAQESISFPNALHSGTLVSSTTTTTVPSYSYYCYIKAS